jgi:hypothetical protein
LSPSRISAAHYSLLQHTLHAFRLWEMRERLVLRPNSPGRIVMFFPKIDLMMRFWASGCKIRDDEEG